MPSSSIQRKAEQFSYLYLAARYLFSLSLSLSLPIFSKAFTMSVLLLAFALMATLGVDQARACGFTTHNLIANRTRALFRDATGINAGNSPASAQPLALCCACALHMPSAETALMLDCRIAHQSACGCASRYGLLAADCAADLQSKAERPSQTTSTHVAATMMRYVTALAWNRP